MGDFSLPHISCYDRSEDLPPCDVVIVGLKTTQNHLLATMLPQVLKDDGLVLLLQNGLGAESHIAPWLQPTQTLVGGLCFICANKVGPGHIRHLDYGQVLLGEYGPDYGVRRISPKLRQVQADFQKAAIAVELTEDLLLARWKKLVWNIPFNGLSVVLDATTAEIMAQEASRSLVAALMDEVILGARSGDRTIPESFKTKMLEDTANMISYRTSMKIDFDEGRPLEVEAMFGQPLAMARRQGVMLPRIEMLYQQLCFLDPAASPASAKI